MPLRLDDDLFTALMERMVEGYAEFGAYTGKIETIAGVEHLSAYHWVNNEPRLVGIRPVERTVRADR